ncbi:MAG: pyridoxal phosphate-dependent aminotransferase [Terriglobales bacterium]
MPAATQMKTTLTERINRIEISATLAVVNEAERMRQAGADLVDFGAGEPHFQTPRHIKDAAIAAIEANFTKYTPVGGTAELRDAIVKRHTEDFGTAYKREETMASTGGKHVLFNAIQVLVEHGDEVIIPVPAWVSFKDIVRYAGGEPVFVETDEGKGFAVTPEIVERAITPRTKAIILNSPCNPTGAVMAPEDYAAIVRKAAERGIWVISDECYVYLDYSGRRFSAGKVTEAKERLVIVGSLSKTYAMTGWRLGYVLGPKDVVSAMQKLQSQSTSNPTSIVQKAAVGALTGPQQCIADMRAEYIQLRDRMVDGLRAIPSVQCNVPQGAFYAYPNVSAFFGRKGVNSSSDVSSRLLRDAQVVTVPGEAFGTREHIRLSYPTTPKEIDRGLERMRKFFGELQ